MGSGTKYFLLSMIAVITLAGCKDRVIWNDNGKVEEATKDREVWNSGGQINTGERKIWSDQNDKPVVK